MNTDPVIIIIILAAALDSGAVPLDISHRLCLCRGDGQYYRLFDL